jgi:hypothetical protein
MGGTAPKHLQDPSNACDVAQMGHGFRRDGSQANSARTITSAFAWPPSSPPTCAYDDMGPKCAPTDAMAGLLAT